MITKNQKDSWKLFYESINEFTHQYYGGLLSEEHLAQFGQVHFTKFWLPNTEEVTEYEFWGYWLMKDGENYLIASHDEEGNEIKIKDLLPIKAQNILKVADSNGSKGEVYYIVTNPVPMRIGGEKKFTPKQFIDNLCMLEHSNPDHTKILMFQAISQLWDRSYYRVASNPGNGKDSSVDICNALFGNCGTIESPTIAKLEDRAASLKWLVVNEVVDIQKGDWDIIQQFLLTAGARKNKITKHSRAFKNVQEIIDVSNFSLSLFYNDINCYPDKKGEGFMPYFDATTKNAVCNRFPAFRLYGQFTENFNAMSRVSVKNFVKENFDWYVNMVKTFEYFKEHYHNYLHNWDDGKLMEFKGRDATNMGILIKIVDFYSESQAEFDKWLNVINDSILDYLEMLSFPRLWRQLEKKSTEKEMHKIEKEIAKISTFKDKNIYVERLIKGETVTKKTTKSIYEFGKVAENINKVEKEIL